jgi:hypothetical protein
MLGNYFVLAYLQVSQDPSRVEKLSGALLLGRLFALPANITQGQQGLTGINVLAYLQVSHEPTLEDRTQKILLSGRLFAFLVNKLGCLSLTSLSCQD